MTNLLAQFAADMRAMFAPLFSERPPVSTVSLPRIPPLDFPPLEITMTTPDEITLSTPDDEPLPVYEEGPEALTGEHTRLPNELGGGPDTYRARCSCGWKGPWRDPGETMPQADFRTHRDSTPSTWAPLHATATEHYAGEPLGYGTVTEHDDGSLEITVARDTTPSTLAPRPPADLTGQTVKLSGTVARFNEETPDGRMITSLDSTGMPLTLVAPVWGKVGAVGTSRLDARELYVSGSMEAWAFLELADENGRVPAAVTLDPYESEPWAVDLGDMTTPMPPFRMSGTPAAIGVYRDGTPPGWYLQGPRPDTVTLSLELRMWRAGYDACRADAQPKFRVFAEEWEQVAVVGEEKVDARTSERSTRLMVNLPVPKIGETWELAGNEPQMVVGVVSGGWVWSYPAALRAEDAVPLVHPIRVDSRRLEEAPLVPQVGETWDFPHNGPVEVAEVWRDYALVWPLVAELPHRRRGGTPVICAVEQLTARLAPALGTPESGFDVFRGRNLVGARGRFGHAPVVYLGHVPAPPGWEGPESGWFVIARTDTPVPTPLLVDVDIDGLTVD